MSAALPTPLTNVSLTPICRKHAFLERGFDAHRSRLESISARIVGCPDLARDAVQDAAIRLWQLEEVPADCVGWLVHAVLHRSLHLRRSARRRRHHESCECDVHGDVPVDPADVAFERELACILEGALAELSPALREVFELRHREQLEYEAIADRLGIPVGTVRSRLSRARERIESELGPALRDDACPVCSVDSPAD